MKAPAKVNLHLDIKQRRADGFHDLVSLFQRIDLHDDIDLIFEPAPVFSCRIDDGQDIPLESNTMYRAADLFSRTTGIGFSLSIDCRKRIPATGGLGGGSSDAAAVLLGLQKLTSFPLAEAELKQTGAAIGSDVPFFLSAPAAVVTGRGEFVEPVEPRDDISGILIAPDFGVSTPEAFRVLDERRVQQPDPCQVLSVEEIREIYKRPVSSWTFFNSFTEVLVERYPVYEQYRRLLSECGYEFIAISGSGSSLIALSDGCNTTVSHREIAAFPGNPALVAIKVLAE